MKSTTIVTGDRPLKPIGYKYNYMRVLGFIATKGDVITELGDPYFSCLPDIYSNVSVCPVVRTHLLGRYFNACYVIGNSNMMWQQELLLDKYWMTQSGYSRPATTVELGMGITDGNLLFCHGISEESVDNIISTRDYNHRTVYD